VVLIGADHWLKAFPNTSMHIDLPPKLQDLTLEYTFKAKNYPKMRIELSAKGYKAEISLGMLDGNLQYQGRGSGIDLPNGKAKHSAYKENEINRLALAI
jgi:hypothetical protein